MDPTSPAVEGAPSAAATSRTGSPEPDPLASERRWIAAELHDGPAQTLANAVMTLDLIERALTGGRADEALTELRALRHRLRDELEELRGLIGRVIPPRLAELGLAGAIAERAATILGPDGPEVTLALDAPETVLDERERTVALRVVEEALQNVGRHARASRVAIRSWQDETSWSIEVRDDGRGFDPGTSGGSAPRRFGLGLMAERATMIGGTIAVRSGPDGGTTVMLSVPTRKEQR